MRKRLEIVPVKRPIGHEWDEFYRIYVQAFPKWEREPESKIKKRVFSRRYWLNLGRIGEEIVGFYLFDVVPHPKYVFFSYLVVDQSWHGQGIGTELCKDAISRFRSLAGFDWLFIEAEDRLLNFYTRLGFRKLELEYLVPHYDSPRSISMHLIVLPKDTFVTKIDKDELNGIILHLFTDGYQLSLGDTRLIKQCDKIVNNIKLAD